MSIDILRPYLKPIADAIRAKKGTTETINAQDFATEILNLPSGGSGGGSEGSKDNSFGLYLEGNLIRLYNEDATYLVDNCLYARWDIVEVILPNVEGVGSYAFNECESLRKVDFTKLNELTYPIFSGCPNLEAFIIRNSEVCYLTMFTPENLFRATKIGDGNGYIYVPRSLVDAYKNAEGWSYYADQIVAIEDYSEDGTINGEIILPEQEEVEEVDYGIMNYSNGEFLFGIPAIAGMVWGEWYITDYFSFNYVQEGIIELTANDNIKVNWDGNTYYVVIPNEDGEVTLATGWDLIDSLGEGMGYVMPASELGIEE